MSVQMGIYLAMTVTAIYAVTMTMLATQSRRRDRRGRHATRSPQRLRKEG